MATSDKQLAANRENAKKSTGPRSAEGKQRSAQNSRKHGLTSEKIGMDFLETLPELEAHRNAILDHYNPQNPMELHWVDQIVIAQWRVNQLARWESGIFNDAIRATWEENTDEDDEDAEDLEQYVLNVDPSDKDSTHNWMLSNGMDRIIEKGDHLKLFLRYQAQASRLVCRAEEAIAKLRNEAKVSRQPVAATTTSSSPNEPILEPVECAA